MNGMQIQIKLMRQSILLQSVMLDLLASRLKCEDEEQRKRIQTAISLTTSVLAEIDADD